MPRDGIHSTFSTKRKPRPSTEWSAPTRSCSDCPKRNSDAYAVGAQELRRLAREKQREESRHGGKPYEHRE
jgi:hypothetical protein